MNAPANRMAASVIQVEDLSKSYGPVRAVVDLTFSVKRGEIFGFLGPNGAGKTTTLSILEGLRKADRGRVVVLGMDVGTRATAIKRRIGVQLQSTSLLPDLTAFEQVQLFAWLYGFQPDRGEITSLLQQVGLFDRASSRPHTLSGGQQQRLSLALALINRPEVIFLDEPTTGLDPQSRRVLWAIQIRRVVAPSGGRGAVSMLSAHWLVGLSVDPLKGDIPSAGRHPA